MKQQVLLAQAKVDKALRDEAAAIIEELGLDIPTAIRMYLKGIVRERGIPMNLSLPADRRFETNSLSG